MAEDQSQRIPEMLAVPYEPEQANENAELRALRSFAAVGVAFGLVSVVALPFGLIRFHNGAIVGDFEVSLYTSTIQSPSAQAIWLFVSSILGTGLAMALLVGSVGALTFRRWARPVLLLWAIGSLIEAFGGSLFYFRWMLPPWREHEAQVRGVIDVLVNFGGWGVGSALAIVMLIMLNRPNVRISLKHGD